MRGKYYVLFDKDTIRKMVQKYFKQQNQAKVNAEHSKPLDGVYMFESYLIDRERGVNPPKGFEDAPDGSWYPDWAELGGVIRVLVKAEKVGGRCW